MEKDKAFSIELHMKKVGGEGEEPKPNPILPAFVDCVKTLQQIRFICDRAKRFGVDEEDVNDILELLKGKV